jgi:hypothetical protein
MPDVTSVSINTIRTLCMDAGKFGFTIDNVVAAAMEQSNRAKG